MRVILLFFLIIFASQYRAQQLNDSTALMKNSIGVDLGNAVLLAFKSPLYEKSFSIDFRRDIAENKKFRVFADYRTLNEDPANNNFLLYADSSGAVFEEISISDKYYGLRCGLEWYKGDKKIHAYYAVDLVLGYKEEKDIYNYVVYPAENCPQCSSPSYVEATENGKVNYLNVGANLSFGPRMMISERFDLCLQFNPGISFKTPVSESYSQANLRREAPESRIILNYGGAELFVHYLF